MWKSIGVLQISTEMHVFPSVPLILMAVEDSESGWFLRKFG